MDLQPIKEALNKATPGPWRQGTPEHLIFGARTPNGGGYGGVARASARYMNRSERLANAHLIANAPTWLAQLVAEVEQLRADRDAMAAQLAAAKSWIEDDCGADWPLDTIHAAAADLLDKAAERDASLIANAPQWLMALVAEVERLRGGATMPPASAVPATPPVMLAAIEAAGKVCDCVTALLEHKNTPQEAEVMRLLEMLHADWLGVVTAAIEADREEN